ncbi:flavin reductase family protein [Saccharopolyspora flava]|uniref:NADH-FMN oxidoreductase RutF, flavin reductase (DIM6/NTAB) family n=1 Tax=Saccharopolyspora flava TaxID=95161 RepID=A0A1I6V2F6_9PSEU|nr:flavin reductase family protein [Saccharopolyspora flava]SFT07899.1 NADH-FMN oxidoreductase RutF, flavin reductase (DIM6/NTAB) family [Saccharopolyspora flava]
MLGTAELRRALGHYPTGVSVVTATGADGTPVGMVVGTFTSVSLDPPLVGFLPDRRSTSWPRIRAAGRFCVNVLAASQEEVCRDFADKRPGRFEAHGEPGPCGPRLAGAVLRVDCDVDRVLPAGDHELVLGRVRALEASPEAGEPMVFWRGRYAAPAV